MKIGQPPNPDTGSCAGCLAVPVVGALLGLLVAILARGKSI